MKTRYEQRGMTAIGWMLVLGLIGFFTLITLRLAPLYLEHAKIASVLEGLEDDTSVRSKSKSELQKILDKRFEVNDIRNVPHKDVLIVNEPGLMKIGIDYERRVRLFYNIDLVASFSKHVEVISR